MERIDGINATMAVPYDKVVANIRASEQRGLQQIHDFADWREGMPVALVGGGPSLHETLPELKRYHNIMACGSVYDHLVGNGIIPRWCVLCDPDPVMANYVRRAHWDTTFLVASQCDPAVFKELDDRKVVVWNCGGDVEDNTAIWGDQRTVVVGGGTTVGTRAIIIAMNFGFANIHLFGFDTCVSDKTHAYPVAEDVGDIIPIRLSGPEGREFRMARYHISQLFDFKKTLEVFGHRFRVTVHGDGVLAELMRLSKETAQGLRAAA